MVAAAVLLLASGCGGGTPAPVDTGGVSSPPPPPPPVQHSGVTTYHNDNARSGVNSLETTLTPANVNVVTFGKLASIPVEGDVYAQPLYLSNVTTVDGRSHNLIVIATEHDQVYAIDADTRTILWQRSFLDSQGLVTPVPSSDVNCPDLAPEIGITGTPVIDARSATLYLVARTKETQNGEAAYYQRLHALRLSDGSDALPATVVSTPSGDFGAARFDPLVNNQRAALLLAKGEVYVAWASHCDTGGFAGWLMAFNETTLRPTGAWTPAPSGTLGGIWMSSGGPAEDAGGNIYLAVGNGVSDVMLGGENYGDSVVRLQSSGLTFSVDDYFIPFDFQWRLDDDIDLGSGATVFLPAQPGTAHPHLLIVASKDGMIFLLDRDNLGKWRMDDNNQVVQSFQNGSQLSFTTPAVWNNTVYFAFPYEPVQAYAFDPVAQQINTTPTSTSGDLQFGYPGASPSVSSSGSGSGIVWVLQTDQFQNYGYAVLRAFDATNLGNELFDSDMSFDRDHAGGAVKFTVPTVIAGQVVIGAHDEVDIFGLLPQ